MSSQTIAAIATPAGEGALGVIRLSGPEALAIADRVFRGAVKLRDAKGYTLHLGVVEDDAGRVLDDVLAAVFRAPHSYTGEDAVEFSGHGGIHVLGEVLDAVLAAGARPAAPGDFTRRAFLNGKMDLSQAEAVGDIIAARSERAHRVSLEQLHGKLSAGVAAFRQELISLCALLELELDFAEEGLDLLSREQTRVKIAAMKSTLETLERSFSTGRFMRDGVRVVLAGPPNAGKSSLFNALLQEERAIVTHMAGTTRDWLEESITLEGVEFRLVDTAGMRTPDNIVEEMGITRTRNVVTTADIILYIVDSTIAQDSTPTEILHREKNQKVILTFNKIDLGGLSGHDELEKTLSPEGLAHVSAKHGDGLSELKQILVRTAGFIESSEGSSLQLTNKRHVAAIRNAIQALARGEQGVTDGISGEFVAADIREATNSLAEISGEVTSQDVLDEIFGKFCIGK